MELLSTISNPTASPFKLRSNGLLVRHWKANQNAFDLDAHGCNHFVHYNEKTAEIFKKYLKQRTHIFKDLPMLTKIF